MSNHILFDDATLCSVRDRMAKHVWPIVTPLTCSVAEERGVALATGNYALIEEQIVVVTNSHVIEDAQGNPIGHLPGPTDDYIRCGPIYLAEPFPIDLAILQISGVPFPKERRRLLSEQLDARFSSREGELLFFLGFPGSKAQRHEPVTETNTRYSWFGRIEMAGVPMLTTLSVVPTDLPHFDPALHVAVHFPARAKKHPAGPEEDIPNAKGFSGSLLWDTRYLACKQEGMEWSPERARVCGLIWAAHQKPEVVVATKIESVVSPLTKMVRELVRQAT